LSETNVQGRVSVGVARESASMGLRAVKRWEKRMVGFGTDGVGMWRVSGKEMRIKSDESEETEHAGFIYLFTLYVCRIAVILNSRRNFDSHDVEEIYINQVCMVSECASNIDSAV
jgi:hypothetical protein